MNLPYVFPYQGGKRHMASDILAYVPADTTRIIEAFAGSAALSLAAAARNLSPLFLLNDLNEPLIQLWRAIINEPAKISRLYSYFWNAQHKDTNHYYKIRKKFNETGQPGYLLYLLARCVTGSVRYNSEGHFNQSADNRRFGVLPETMKKHINYASGLLKFKTECTSLDYKAIVASAEPTDLVYLDPPYQGVCGNRDSRYFEKVDFDEFVQVLESLNQRSISFIVSYDGKTGAKHYGKTLPKHLNLLHQELSCGRSAQATLNGQSSLKYESLYISHVTLNRCKNCKKGDAIK
jgi:DNA adenine methylase